MRLYALKIYGRIILSIQHIPESFSYDLFLKDKNWGTPVIYGLDQFSSHSSILYRIHIHRTLEE